MSSDPRLERLNNILCSIAPEKTLAIAFSGGLDSRFLTFAARKLGFKVKAFHVSGPHITKEETQEAEDWCAKQGIELEVLCLNPLEVDEVAFNRHDRCYFCKKRLFSTLLQQAGSVPLCDGTNHSDLSYYRPGLKALEELHIYSPLAEAGMSKQDNREVGKLIGLDHWEQAARPCMLTRLPYNQKVKVQDLSAIAEAETNVSAYLQTLNKGEFRFRLRKVSPDKFEMHIQKEDFEKLSPKEIRAVQQTLSNLHPFEETEWVPMEKLSGFFDLLNHQS